MIFDADVDDKTKMVSKMITIAVKNKIINPYSGTEKYLEIWAAFGEIYELMNEEIGEYCMVCKDFVKGFEYQGCCSGYMCGCMGQPIEPCICDKKECWDKFYNKSSTKG